MAQILMPKATAVWLVENTTLTFEQVAAFCGLHPLEVQGIADGEVAIGIVGLDPTMNGQLTKEEIVRCEADKAARLTMAKHDIPLPAPRTKGPRYTPVSKRQDKPDAVAWLVRHHPELTDAQISKLIGTTKQTIAAVRDRTHWNSPNLRPRDPVLLGLCTQSDLNSAVLKARKALEKATGTRPAAPPAEEPPPPAPAKPTL
ncbi:MAG TPA: cell cycle transcriptional regulator TrcR, partial [Myxococcota bacterium]|nr:cell cycle transcriptional regulator TrcR [Myxococcota bacterium]